MSNRPDWRICLMKTTRFPRWRPVSRIRIWPLSEDIYWIWKFTWIQTARGFTNHQSEMNFLTALRGAFFVFSWSRERLLDFWRFWLKIGDMEEYLESRSLSSFQKKISPNLSFSSFSSWKRAFVRFDPLFRFLTQEDSFWSRFSYSKLLTWLFLLTSDAFCWKKTCQNRSCWVSMRKQESK